MAAKDHPVIAYSSLARLVLTMAIAAGISLAAAGQTILIEEIAQDDNDGGFIINLAEPNGVRSVAPAGDVNNDGVPDIILGSVGVDANGVPDSGAAYVVFGKSGGDSVEIFNVANGVGGFAIPNRDI